MTVTAVYTYNGDGLRVAQAINGVETRFIWDQAAALPQVVATSGGQTAQYLYGLELSGVRQGGQGYSPLADALGSLRQWTDAAGTVVGSASYDPFGGVLSQQGFTSPWGFAGEYHDPATGLQYLRARWYQPGVGRFTQRDPFPGVLALPLTLNPYVYGLNSPTRYTDPSGEFNPWAILAGAAVGGFIGGFTYYHTLDHSTRLLNGRDLGIAIGMGAISGALLASGSAIAIAAAVAGLSSAGTHVLADEHFCFDWPALAGIYVSGAVAAAIVTALPWAWSAHLAGGPLVGGFTSVMGDVSGRVTQQLLLELTGEADWSQVTDFAAYQGTFLWGAAFGFFGVGVNKGIQFYAKRLPNFINGSRLIQQADNCQSTYQSLLRRGFDTSTGSLAFELRINGLRQFADGHDLLQGVQRLIEMRSGLITGLLNSNVGQNLYEYEQNLWGASAQ